MNSIHFWRWATATSVMVIGALIAAIVSLGLVQSADTQSDGAVTQVKAVSATSFSSTESTLAVNLPGAATNVTVPAGQQALIVARFTGSANCLQTPQQTSFCWVGLFIDGNLMSPGAVIFGTVGATDGHPFRAAHEASAVVGPGTHQVRVKYHVDETQSTFEMYAWHLTVERIRK